jgi:hypothetical protein
LSHILDVISEKTKDEEEQIELDAAANRCTSSRSSAEACQDKPVAANPTQNGAALRRYSRGL